MIGFSRNYSFIASSFLLYPGKLVAKSQRNGMVVPVLFLILAIPKKITGGTDL
jgi:hypothetical protein